MLSTSMNQFIHLFRGGFGTQSHIFFTFYQNSAKFIRFTNIGPLRPKSNAYQGRAHTSSPPQLPIPGVLGLWVVRERHNHDACVFIYIYKPIKVLLCDEI